ncbi:MAG: PqqD family protein [Anaerolineales bacterium]|nr:PqqD family protein [Anaerolineales bacterium]
MVTLETTLHVPKDVLFHELAGEAVLLNLVTGKYYGLDEVGTRMWMLLSEHKQIEPAYQALLDEYEVEPERLQSDLLKLADDLVAHGLLALNEA